MEIQSRECNVHGNFYAGQQTRGSLGELLGLLGCWSHCPSGIISAISSGWSLHFSGTWADELLDGFGAPFKNQGD